jgi:hypothetical protein
VADTNNNRVQFFNNDGIFLGMFGGSVSQSGNNSAPLLRYPKAMAVDSQDRVFVVDSEGTRVMVFSSNGEFLGKLSDYKEPFIEQAEIVDICFDVNDNMFLLDGFNNRVTIVNSQGKHVISFGAQGAGLGYFQKASSISVGEGKICVSDYGLNKIQTFRYFVDGLASEERIFATKMVECDRSDELNEVGVYRQAITKATDEARGELNKDLQLSQKELKKFTKIESIEKIKNGQVKVTVSMPRYLLDKLNGNEENAPGTQKVSYEENSKT